MDRAGADVYADDFLYDLRADPWEQTNLIGMAPFADVVADLRTRLVRRMAACGEKAPRFIDAPPAIPSNVRSNTPADPRCPENVRYGQTINRN